MRAEFVPSLWKLYDDGIVFSFSLIVFHQLLAQPSDLDPNRRILPRVVGWWLAERINTNAVLLELVGLATEGLIRQELEKPPQPL
jgi:hypothetical protein